MESPIMQHNHATNPTAPRTIPTLDHISDLDDAYSLAKCELESLAGLICQVRKELQAMKEYAIARGRSESSVEIEFHVVSILIDITQSNADDYADQYCELSKEYRAKYQAAKELAQ
jgi:hypothetical protein